MSDFFAIIAMLALLSAVFSVIGLVISVIRKREHTVRIFSKATWISAIVLFAGIFLSSALSSDVTTPSTDTDNAATSVSNSNVDVRSDPQKTDSSGALKVKSATIYKGHNTIIKTVKSNADSVDFYFENNSNTNLSFCVYSYSVNGIMMAYCNEYDTYTEVAAGKKASGTLEIPSEWLDNNGIDKITEIKVHFWAYGDTVKEFETDIIKLPIENGETAEYTLPHPLYKKDGIAVEDLDTTDSPVVFAVKNERNKYFDFDLENVSVNDWTQEATLSECKTEIFPGCVGAFGIEFDQDDLSKDNINQIEHVEFGLNVRPEGDYFSDFHTGPIVLKRE